MTVILPQGYHNQHVLEAHRIFCMTRDDAFKQDIRPLRIGILNIMPNLENYEFNLLYALGRTILQIDPIWIKLESHSYGSSNPNHLDLHYATFKEAITEKHLDGLIVTGAPVGKIPFEEVHYWDEIESIFSYAQEYVPNTLGICWGGVAISHYLGLKRTFYETKHFGVYPGKNLNRKHPITGDCDDLFFCPQSRFSKIDDRELEQWEKDGKIQLLAYGEESGYFIYATPNDRFIMHLGHPEYNSGRILDEADRDKKLQLDYVKAPENFDLANPINTWRSHRNEFFTAWVKHVYLKTQY
jgi:homoserine O-succinyltransferase